jgi:3-deoxy-7-phosphoheptulonate synthase
MKSNERITKAFVRGLGGEGMVVVMKQGAGEPQVERVIERLTTLGFDAHRSTGSERIVIGAVGGNIEATDPRELEVLEGVKEVFRISKPYKLASRSFQPENSIVRVNGARVGSPAVVVLAGPCAVESEEQIHTIARRCLQAPHVTILVPGPGG